MTAPLSLRVASYNVRKCMGLDRVRDPDRVLSAIAALKADVVALQEADRRLPPRPSAIPFEAIERATGLVPLPVAESDVSLGWHGNAILVRPEFTLIRHETLNMPAAEPRGAVIADIDIGAAGHLRVVATHLGLARYFRRLQLTAMLGAMDKVEHMPTVLMGDLNEWSVTVGLGRLFPHFEIHAPGLSFHSARPIAALDRIAISRDMKIAASGVDRTEITRVASDHLPIWADLERRR